MPVYVSLGKAAHHLGVTPATVRRWTDSGFLPCRRTAGGHRRIDQKDIEELSQAIGNRGHLETQRQRGRELETLAQASLDVISRLDQGELLAEIARHATRLCRCHTCEIMEYDREADTVRALAEYDSRGQPQPPTGVYALREYPATRRVLERQTPMVVNADERGADPAEVALMRRYGEKSTLMLPLIFRGQTIGLLEVYDREGPRHYSAQELRLYRALAGHAAVALHNARLYSAAQAADVALDQLRLRLATAARGLGALDAADLAADSLDRVARALRAAFEAQSCLIADDEAVLAAATAKVEAAATTEAHARAAHLLSARVPLGGKSLEVSLALPRPPAEGEADLLALVAVTAASLAARR